MYREALIHHRERRRLRAEKHITAPPCLHCCVVSLSFSRPWPAREMHILMSRWFYNCKREWNDFYTAIRICVFMVEFHREYVREKRSNKIYIVNVVSSLDWPLDVILGSFFRIRRSASCDQFFVFFVVCIKFYEFYLPFASQRWR